MERRTRKPIVEAADPAPAHRSPDQRLGGEQHDGDASRGYGGHLKDTQRLTPSFAADDTANAVSFEAERSARVGRKRGQLHLCFKSNSSIAFTPAGVAASTAGGSLIPCAASAASISVCATSARSRLLAWLAQPHPSAGAILRNERDAGGLESRYDGFDGTLLS